MPAGVGARKGVFRKGGLFGKVHALVLFKAQLGEARLEILIFFLIFFIFFSAKAVLKAPKPALKRQNRHLSVQTGT